VSNACGSTPSVTDRKAASRRCNPGTRRSIAGMDSPESAALSLHRNNHIQPVMMHAPSAKRSGLAAFPFLLVNKDAYRFSISGHGMVCAFFTQRLFSFRSIPIGCLKSDKLIWPLL